MKHERDYLRTAVVTIAVMLLLGAFMFVPDAQGQTRFTRFRSVLIEHDLDVLGDLDIEGDVDVNGTVNFDEMDVDGTLTVGGAVDFDDTFLVDGATTLDNTVEINGDVTLENDETISNDVNGVITATATTFNVTGNLETSGTLDVQGGAVTLESDDTIDNPSSGDITVAATTVTLDGEGVVTGGLDVQGGNVVLQNDESISNATNGIITATATTIVAAGELVTTGGLDVQGGDIVLENDETIGNGGDGTILLTADSVDVSAGLDVDGLADLDTVDIDDLVNITRVTGTTGAYEDLILAEWTNSAADASYGSNGIYMSTNPIYDVQNTYGVRSRLDMRGAGAGTDVSVNQLHAMDALINFNETKTYTVTDNISVYGAAVHGGTSNDVIAAGATGGSVNLYYGMWGSTANQNLSVGTVGMYLGSHAGTYLDYGTVIANSGTMTAGLSLVNHASNEPAIMAYGVYMESASENMGDGINMEDADFTGDDIVLDSGETINNSTDGTIAMDGIVDVSGNLLFGANNLSAVGYASAGTAIVAGVTAEFTATTTVASGLTTVISAVCVPYADPASTAATCSADWSGATVTLHSWKAADAAAGDTGTTVNYIIFGTK